MERPGSMRPAIRDRGAGRSSNLMNPMKDAPLVKQGLQCYPVPMSTASHGRNTAEPAQESQESAIGTDAERASNLTQAEQERAMAALDSVRAGRVKPANDVRRRAEALLGR